ncbi:aminotransferase [Phycicoccus sp. CSK15P-2]|uniref:aminotransferase class V-fold PLP-dependent enzyme n=1 Tax=Phycicoccus sp. CSK15P-2 TaxID=2807627 RepID=UPI00194FDD23|nr:aminotransferase class V-fold PLP-dependent enzyme [Phycicoccus sp. CSK15P-2]MBM6404062.1 aminotransferase [Phycicoccus sp. CSK15P-2]
MAHGTFDSPRGDPSTDTPRGVLDAAPGPLHPAAGQTLAAASRVSWADPVRLHAPGRRSRALLDTARAVLAEALEVRPEDLSVHPTAEDALAVGLDGLRHARRRVGQRVVASAVERSVVLLRGDVEDPVPVGPTGRVDVASFTAQVAEPGVAAAVSQTANGEVGTHQPVLDLARAAADAGVPLLVDATASLGRDPLPGVGDVVVADAAAFGGPPLGLLAVRPGTRWGLPGPRREAEHGRALATPWVPSVLAAAEAWRQGTASHRTDAERARVLVSRVRTAAAAVRDVEVVGDPDARLPHVVTFSVLLADGEVLVEELARRGLAVGSGSACTSSALRPSHVLAAMGVLTHGNVRVTLPLESVCPDREEDVDRLCAVLAEVVAAVRERLGTADL